MKKFLFFASYVFALFMICSCTNEEVLTSMETANETTYKTLTELEAYNKVMLGKVITRGSDNKSKGNVTTDDVADAINVVKADAEGAAVGLWLGKGVAVGAGAVTGGMGHLLRKHFSDLFSVRLLHIRQLRITKRQQVIRMSKTRILTLRKRVSPQIRFLWIQLFCKYQKKCIWIILAHVNKMFMFIMRCQRKYKYRSVLGI